uniref:DUF4704 domain-containing protein n=2 Tax=Macrostomum lignano TaxID=282301 RepID=A0A1I8I778_9PLAT
MDFLLKEKSLLRIGETLKSKKCSRRTSGSVLSRNRILRIRLTSFVCLPVFGLKSHRRATRSHSPPEGSCGGVDHLLLVILGPGLQLVLGRLAPFVNSFGLGLVFLGNFSFEFYAPLANLFWLALLSVGRADGRIGVLGTVLLSWRLLEPMTNGRSDTISPSPQSTTTTAAIAGAAGDVEDTEATDAEERPTNEVTAPMPPPLQAPVRAAGAPGKEKKAASANRCQLLFNSETRISEGFAALLERVKAEPAVTGQFVVENLFFLMVGGPFDQENNFVISGPDVIPPALEIIDLCSQQIQSEVWGTLAAILRKNKRSLMVCCEAGLIQQAVARLPSAGSGPLADFLIDIIECLVSFSVSVKEFKLLFGLLKAKNGVLNSHYVKLLGILRQLTARTGPDEFFSFPGKKGSAISIPPISKWPYQNGWTFHCWFYTDPPSDSSVERDKPHLFCFRTDKGMGYSGHFIGNALIITVMKVKGKGFQHSIRYDFVPRKWHMLTVVFVYNRWSKSEIRTYVNGTLVTQTELSWVVNTNEPFDRCFIGSASRSEADCMFSGQISSIYGFAEALSPQQIAGVFALGPAYKSSLSGAQKTALYRPDSRLHSSIMFTYNPVACDGQLCLEQSPKVCGQPLQPSVFVHSGHALMTGEARSVCTHSIFSTLHSLGGVQIFLPLFGQLGDAGSEANGGGQEVTGSDICAALLALLGDLLQSSQSIQQQFMQNKGFLVISQYLTKESLTDKVLDEFVKMTKQLAQNKTSVGLVKQLFDHVLFNPTLWIKAPVQVQIRLYKFLATDFVASVGIFNSVRRVSAVLQTIHTLKHYYWIVHPQDRSGFAPQVSMCVTHEVTRETLEGEWARADIHDLTTIRASLLIYIKQLILRGNGILDDEMQAILNYLMTISGMCFTSRVTLMAEHPAPPWCRHSTGSTLFEPCSNCLASHDEKIRIHALKLLGYFLMRSTSKRKHDVLTTHNLFSLIGERLMLFSPCVSMASYNALFELLTEKVTLYITDKRHPEPEANYRLEN